MRKPKIAVLMGGKSPEYDVSISSGYQVFRSIGKANKQVIPVVVSRSGDKWLALDGNEIRRIGKVPIVGYDEKKAEIRKYEHLSPQSLRQRQNVDVVFVAMHGPFGEDGAVQGMLDLAGLKYTGSGILASALGMNKVMFRKLMKSVGISVPRHAVVKKGESIPSNLKVLIGSFPYIVKPSSQGSSVGVTIAKNHNELRNSLEKCFTYGEYALIDELIKGKELTVSLLGNKNVEALPVIEIFPKKGNFFDYESKYAESGADEVVPANISEEIGRLCQEVAVRVYKELGCRGFGRVDMILQHDNKPIVLEINTIPGLTPMSLLPKAAKAAGISYENLINKIIAYALEE